MLWCFSHEFMTLQYRVVYLLGLKKVYSLPGKHYIYNFFFFFYSWAEQIDLTFGHAPAWTLTYKGDTKSHTVITSQHGLLPPLKRKGSVMGSCSGDVRRLLSTPGERWGHSIPPWARCRKFLEEKLIRHGMEIYLGLCRSGITSPVTSPRLTNGLVVRWRVGLLVCVSGDGLDEGKKAWSWGRNEPQGGCQLLHLSVFNNR